jgi:hypothetical protein
LKGIFTSALPRPWVLRVHRGRESGPIRRRWNPAGGRRCRSGKSRQQPHQRIRVNAQAGQAGHAHQYAESGRHQCGPVERGQAGQRGDGQHRNGDGDEGVGQVELIIAVVQRVVGLLILLGLTALYWAALVPTGFGVLMGVAGLTGLGIHPDALVRLLS